MTRPAPPAAQEYATGFLRTTVHPHGSGYEWIRRPGDDRPVPLSAPDEPVRAALSALRPAGLRLALPKADGDALRYRVPGLVPVAKLCVGRDPRLPPGPVAGALSATGAALHLLHTAVPASLAVSGPPGPARLASWMREGTGPRAAPAFHTLVRRQLGSARWDLVLEWCHSLATGLSGGVFLHGAPSLGSIVIGDAPADGCLMAGEDVARGPADFDLGWLLGEFVEWRMTLSRRTPGLDLDPHDFHSALGALADGYGAPADPVSAGHGAVLRVFTHAHDFAAYMGWHPELLEYTVKIAELIDDEGAQALI
ncbi:hypothetical protein ACFY93_26120 [Streptomyces sp. NPDC008313]|uniref:hypothetical protein n=1 Tax=Streptomyces sp. NPDC008313 TaxID=3364826 RepID=UPI0036E1A200